MVASIANRDSKSLDAEYLGVCQIGVICSRVAQTDAPEAEKKERRDTRRSRFASYALQRSKNLVQQVCDLLQNAAQRPAAIQQVRD